MRTRRATVSSLASSAPIVLDQYLNPFNVSIAVVLSAGAALTYTVQHTYDDVFVAGFDPSTATWWNNTGVTNKMANAEGNYALPVAAVRLTVTSYTGGSATIVAMQAGVLGS